MRGDRAHSAGRRQYMEKLTIDEVIQDCNNTCSGYELASELSKKPIQNQQNYIKHYQIAEWLMELKVYKETGLTPEKISEMDRLYTEKCIEVNKLKAKLENCIGAI